MAEEVITATGANNATVTASCPADHPNALGGGYDNVANPAAPIIDAPVFTGPGAPATGWTVQGAPTTAVAGAKITAYAICAK